MRSKVIEDDELRRLRVGEEDFDAGDDVDDVIDVGDDVERNHIR